MIKKEENPFETKEGSELWIKSVENEKGQIRDRYFYPLLKHWLEDENINTVLDIGGGQGVASQFCLGKKYTNLEPSEYLVKRAKEIYPNNTNHIMGSVYEMPFEDSSFDAAFSITVWFHLKDIDKAAHELSRVLRDGGKFLIINPNPKSYSTWRTLYSNIEDIDEKSFVGKASVPHAILPRNTFFKHTNEDVIKSLKTVGLMVDEQNEFAPFSARFGETNEDVDLFVYYMGHKI